jgi:hypothetical protein
MLYKLRQRRLFTYVLKDAQKMLYDGWARRRRPWVVGMMAKTRAS